MKKAIVTFYALALFAPSAFGALDSASRYKNISNIGEITIAGNYPTSITNGSPIRREHVAWIREAAAEMLKCVNYNDSKADVPASITDDIFSREPLNMSNLYLFFDSGVDGLAYFTSNAMPRYINLKLRYHAESIFPNTTNLTDSIDSIIDAEYPRAQYPFPAFPVSGDTIDANTVRTIALGFNAENGYDVIRRDSRFLGWTLLDDDGFDMDGTIKRITQSKYNGTWNTIEEYTSHVGSYGEFITTIATNTSDYGIAPIQFFGYAVISSWAVKTGSHLGGIIDNTAVDVYTMPIIIDVPPGGIGDISSDAYISSLVNVAGMAPQAEVSDPEALQTKSYFTKIKFVIYGVRYTTNSGTGNY